MTNNLSPKTPLEATMIEKLDNLDRSLMGFIEEVSKTNDTFREQITKNKDNIKIAMVILPLCSAVITYAATQALNL